MEGARQLGFEFLSRSHRHINISFQGREVPFHLLFSLFPSLFRFDSAPLRLAFTPVLPCLRLYPATFGFQGLLSILPGFLLSSSSSSVAPLCA